MSRTARYSFMGTRGLRPRGVTVYFRTDLVGTLHSATAIARGSAAERAAGTFGVRPAGNGNGGSTPQGKDLRQQIGQTARADGAPRRLASRALPQRRKFDGAARRLGGGAPRVNLVPVVDGYVACLSANCAAWRAAHPVPVPPTARSTATRAPRSSNGPRNCGGPRPEAGWAPSASSARPGTDTAAPRPTAASGSAGDSRSAPPPAVLQRAQRRKRRTAPPRVVTSAA